MMPPRFVLSLLLFMPSLMAFQLSPPTRSLLKPPIRVLFAEQPAGDDNDRLNIADIAKEAEEALQAANSVLNESKNNNNSSTQKARAAVSEALQKDIIATVIGGSAVGAAIGAALLANIPELGAADIPEIVPPIIAAALTGGAAFAGASQDGQVGTITRTVLGKPTEFIGNAVMGFLAKAGSSIVDGIKAIPSKIATAAKNKADQTVAEVKAIPSKIQKELEAIPEKVQLAAQKTANDAAKEIKALPGRAATAASAAAEKAVDEISQVPGRIVESTTKAVTKAVDDALDAPKRGLEKLGLTKPDAPTPPKMPPPAEIKQDIKTKLELPNLTTKILPTPPKAPPQQESRTLSLPKMEPPSLPKLELPELVLPKTEQSLSSNTENNSNFVFSEISLKKIMDRAGTETGAGPAEGREQAEAKRRQEAIKNQKEDETRQRAFEQKREKEQARKRESEAEAKRAAAEQTRLAKEQQQQIAAEAKKAAAVKKQQDAEAKAQEKAKLEKQQQVQLKPQREGRSVNLQDAAVERAAQEAAAEKLRKEQEAKQAAAAVAEQKKQEAEARRQAREQAKLEQVRQKERANAQREELARKQQQEAEARRAIQEAAAEKREQEQEQAAKRAAQDNARREQAAAAEEKRLQAQRQREAVAKAAPGATIKKLARAPKGVPTIKNWRQRRDGGVSGLIFGSPNFEDGERIETTKIISDSVENGVIVQTGSGSRYFLSEDKAATSTTALNSLLSSIPGATIKLTQLTKAKDAEAAKQQIEQSTPKSTFSLFGGGFGSFKVETPTQAERTKNAKAAKQQLEQAKPRATLSLFGGGGSSEARAPAQTAAKPSTTSKADAKTAPPGVPTIKQWKRNRDGSVTGKIFGAKSFANGEQVTTSPIVNGRLEKEETVKTGSGSRYYLA
jgi:hypothetical protein